MQPDPNLEDRLIELARKVAEERDWPWDEPVEVSSGVDRGEPVWVISTNTMMIGNSVTIVLRRSDLSLKDAGHLPR